MSAGVGSTPQGTAPTQAPPPAPNLTQAEVEDRVASAFMDSLDESNQQEAKAPSDQAEPEAPGDDPSTDPDADADADDTEADAEPDGGEEEAESDEEEAAPQPKR